MASGDATPTPIKNQAHRVTFPIYDHTGSLVTGAAGLDSEISKDGGTFADCTNEATEIATASGVYYLDISSTEMNADTVVIIVKTSTTNAKTTPIILYPAEATDIPVNVTAISGDTTAADNLEAAADGTGYNLGGGSVVAASVTAGVTLTSAGIDAIFDRSNGVETSLTFREGMRLLVAALAGKVSGASSTTITIRNVADSKNRIVATVDSDGNRTALTYDLT